MYGRHRCLLTCTYIVLLLLSHVLASGDTIKREDGRLMAYKGGEREITGEYATYATDGIVAGAAVGATVGTAVGTVVPVVGNIIGGALGAIFGGITGFAGGTINYGVVKNWCDNQCAEHYACVSAQHVNMKCCRVDFDLQCYSNWGEPITYWAETFAGQATKEDANLAKVTAFWCKRGRDNALQSFVSGNTCPYESNQCYFVFCTRVQAVGGGIFGEWGCVPKNTTDFCGRISSTKEKKCDCHLSSPGDAMGNEVLVDY